MQIVIDIPEVFYEALKKTDEIVSGQRSGKTLMSVIYDAVANGTPLDEQEPKIGHWRYVDYKNARCSNCNYIQTTKGLDKTMHCNIHKAIYKYCPNCGARMEEQE